MALTTGLGAMREKVAAAAKAGNDLPKTEWFKLADGASARVRFAQEIDSDSELYNPDLGLAVMASEVSNPDDFRQKCLSTLEDEGRCFGLEMHQRLQGTDGYKGGWKPKSKVYVNVLVEQPDGSLQVQILSQGLGAKSIIPGLLEAAEEYGSITNREWKITRTGSEFNNTSYNLLPLREDKDPFDYSAYDLYDLDKVAVRHVPYDEQAAFFGFGDGVVDTEASSANVDW